MDKYSFDNKKQTFSVQDELTPFELFLRMLNENKKNPNLKFINDDIIHKEYDTGFEIELFTANTEDNVLILKTALEFIRLYPFFKLWKSEQLSFRIVYKL